MPYAQDQIKICKKCSIQYATRSPRNLGWCTICKWNIDSEKWRKTNPSKKSQSDKIYREKNKDRIIKYRESNRDYWVKYNKEWNQKFRHKYYEENKSEILKFNAAWRDKNPEYHTTYERERMQKELPYKLIRYLRTRLYYALKGKTKPETTKEALGCTPDELKVHLQSRFRDNMSWDNYGKKCGSKRWWEVDHIIPLSSFDLTNPQEYKKACHYTNLQPLWRDENVKKGKKIDG